MSRRRVAACVLAVGTLITLAGCTPSAAAPPNTGADAASVSPSTSTPSSTASIPASPSSAVRIVLDADALSIEDTLGTIAHSYPYANGAADAITELTTLLGAPVSTSYAPPGGCWSNMTTVKWHTLTMTYYGQDAATTQIFMLDTYRTPPAAVDITTPHGARVGSAWGPYFANVPGHLTETATYQGQQLISVVDTIGSNGDRSGTIVSAADNLITTIAAPSSLDADC